MKQTMMWAILALTAIVMMSLFDLHLFPVKPVVSIPAGVAGTELYVCPAVTGGAWDTASNMLGIFSDYIIIAFLCVVMILLFVWGWAMYQNLLNDKFDRKSFSNPWKYTKLAFWAAAVVIILTATPNHFRRVTVTGAPGEWVLCENVSPARAVHASAVQAH